MEIGVWGGSIAYGACDTEGLGWVGRLRKKFPQDDSVGVYNRGVCGDSTEDLLRRFETEARSIEPDVVIFSVGWNDLKYPAGQSSSNVPLEKYAANIRRLIELTRAHTDKIYLTGLTKVDENIPRPKGSVFKNDVLAQYNSVLENIAKEEQLVFISLIDTLDITTDLADGLHPNAHGYEKIYQVVANYF